MALLGWALGVNITTGKEGNFPLDCLASYADPSPTTGPKKTKQRVSSIFDVDDSKTAQTPAINTHKADGSDKVVYSFEPERPDEIVLRVGDVVVVTQAYDDGWGYGKNISTGNLSSSMD
ncbi:hypothetical protein BC830DRAFT_1061607 [Chytriomyces sp. MP71]|nr:hypothetical protein BC830DRAFT_1061607 [Chytriomyces sp. MP71]